MQNFSAVAEILQDYILRTQSETVGLLNLGVILVQLKSQICECFKKILRARRAGWALGSQVSTYQSISMSSSSPPGVTDHSNVDVS